MASAGKTEIESFELRMPDGNSSVKSSGRRLAKIRDIV